MIWIQFSSALDASPSTAFVGTDVEVLIKVLTDPLVEGITVKGQVVCPPDGSEVELDFTGSNEASFKLDEHRKGKYTVEATVVKDGYRDVTISANFYYVDKPHIAELGSAI